MPLVRAIAVTGVAAALVLLTAAPAPAEPGEPAPRPGQNVLVAGLGEPGYSGDGRPARDARLSTYARVEVAPDGTVYIADTGNGRLRRVGSDGVIDTMPGTRARRSPQTDGPEVDGLTYSPSNRPMATAAGADGTLYAAFEEDIRRIDRSGKATVIGGNGELGTLGTGGFGDGGPATRAWIYEPADIAVDGAGNVYVADGNNGRIRRIDRRGTISTVAGGGGLDLHAAEGKRATSIDAVRPKYLAADRAGTVYFAEDGSGAVYRIGREGTLTHVTDVPADHRVAGLAVDAEDTLFVADGSGGMYRAGADGELTVVAPTTTGVSDLAVGPDGDLYVIGEARVLRLVRHGEAGSGPAQRPARSRWAGDEPGTVHTVAGTGDEPDVETVARPAPGRSGPTGVATGADGTVYIAEPFAHRVRAIGPDGKVTDFAGTGESGTGGDGRPAEEAALAEPQAVATGPEGDVYIADTGNDRVQRVDADGIVSTLATVPAPARLALDAAGAVYATSVDGKLVRKIDPAGRVTPVAGGGERWAEDADGAPAGQASLWEPGPVAVGRDGTVYLVEDGKPSVRAVRPDGVLVTVAGNAYLGLDEGGFAGDGGPATKAELNTPAGLAVGADGSRYVADSYNNRIRRIDPGGRITTFAGTGERADRGDGGPAARAALTEPTGLAFGPDGALYVTGQATQRVRRIDSDGTISTLADLASASRKESATKTDLGRVSSFAAGADGTVYLNTSLGDLRAVAPDGTLGTVEPDPAHPEGSYRAIAAGPDGSLYLGSNEVVRRYPDGVEVTLAGGGFGDKPPVEGKQSFDAFLPVSDLATGPDGELYVLGDKVIYALREDGMLEKVLSGAGELTGIGVGPDGALYAVADSRVVSVTDGKAEPVAGTGEPFSPADEEEDEDGGPALDATIANPSDVAVTPDGSVFVSTSEGLRRIDADGDIETVVRPRGDGAQSLGMGSLAVGPGGDLYFGDKLGGQVRVVVRPGEWEAPYRFPWTAFWLVLLGIVLAAGVVLVLRRRTRLASEPSTAGPSDKPPVATEPSEPDPAEPTAPDEPGSPPADPAPAKD